MQGSDDLMKVVGIHDGLMLFACTLRNLYAEHTLLVAACMTLALTTPIHHIR